MFRNRIIEEIRKIAGDDAVFNVERPENEAHGDYSSNVALVKAKKEGKSPKEVAESLKNSLGHSVSKFVEKVEIAGPGFINFFISKEAVLEGLEKAAEEKNNFGRSARLTNKKVIIEYTDPNPFKEFHIGHLMPNCIGESLARIVEFNGAQVKRANYQGDVGMHVAYAMASLTEDIEKAGGFENFRKGAEGAELSDEDFGRKIFYAYAAGVKKAKESPEFAARAKEINKKLYDKSDANLTGLYDLFRGVHLMYFEYIYGNILGMRETAPGKHFDFYFFESETAEPGKKIVEEGLKKKIFEQSDGAVVYKGEEDGLHTRVFINSEGLPTYEAKELGLAVLKHEKYPFDLSYVVTANEQTDYFRVVLAAEKKIYPELAQKTVHIPHGLLRLPSGKMSSRTGEVVPAEALFLEVESRLRSRFEQSEKISADESEAVLKMVTRGAIKYSILKNSIGSDIIFDFEKSLALEGDSGPYIQYVHARTRSVAEKAAAEKIKESFSNPPAEPATLEKLVLRFPDVVESAYENLNPGVVSRYLLELAGEFNAFYEKQKIIGVEHSPYYVALTDAVSQTIKNGLSLLGIDAPEKM